MSVLGGSHLPAVSPASSILWVLPLGGLWPCQAEVGVRWESWELVVVVCLGADPVSPSLCSSLLPCCALAS